MISCLQKRRSIRKFKETGIEKEKVNKLVKAALLSPSSRNIRPWEFIVVEDKCLLEKLSHSKLHGSTLLKGAPLGIVVIANSDESDVWVEDTSIASIIIQLTAETLGLGSCWIQIRKRMHDNNISSEEYVRNELNIPEHYKVASIIALGYPDETKHPYTEDDLQYDKVFINNHLHQYK